MKPENSENATTETKYTIDQHTVDNIVPHFKHKLPKRPGEMFQNGDMARLEVGQIAPDFRVETTQGQVSLQDLLAKCDEGVVVYFYPRASTPGCTKEACDFHSSLPSLLGAGYQIIGISPDKTPALGKFRDKQGLAFPLGSDPEKAVLEAWGAWGEKKLYGKITCGTIRSTIVVGRDGHVMLAKYGMRATGHVTRLRRDLGLDWHFSSAQTVNNYMVCEGVAALRIRAP